MKKVSLTIDGKKIGVDEGTTILQAAGTAGIDIPNLCYDPRLKPTGSCRLCVVQIDGINGLTTSCNTAVAEGMVVCTENEQIADVRKTILELMLSEHNAACTTCDKQGNCKLQDYAYRYQADENRFARTRQETARDNYTSTSQAIAYNPDRCIRCGLCIRYCQEVQKADALTFAGPAEQMEVSSAFGIELHKSSCVLCGGCVEICPTGAMLDKAAIGKGREKDLTRTRTLCGYCGVGCQIDLFTDSRTNRLVRVGTSLDYVPNKGNLCVKGKFGMDFISSTERLSSPLVKRDGKLEETSWDEAIEFIVERLSKIKSEHGPEAIAGLASAKCTNEENYIFQKFIRTALGSNNVDHCARLCHASTVTGLAAAFGNGAMTNTIAELAGSSCIFVIGSNTTESHPVIGLFIKEAVTKNGAKLIVADPRTIELVGFAELHLAHRPGTDVALINAMLNVIIRENLLDTDFIKAKTVDFEKLAETVKDFTPEKAELITTVPAEMIRQAARMYAVNSPAAIVYSMGITQHTTGTDNVLSLANLALATGNVGKESAGVNALRGQNNVQGACDCGALPDVLCGYQSVDDRDINHKFETAWQTKLSRTKGLTALEMIHAIEKGRIKALYMMGENIALSDPNLARTRAALKKVDFLVVQDIFLSETAKYADVVLPSACFAEKDGTFTNTERRIQRVRKALEPPGSAREDWQILCELSIKMGYQMHYDSPEQIMDEIASLSLIYAGVSYDRLGDRGLQWPCWDKNHPGTKFLYENSFKKEQGKGRFHAVTYRRAAEEPSEKFPFVLSTGRLLYQFHTATMTRKSRSIAQKSSAGYIEINPSDAERLGICDGGIVEVATARGSVQTNACVTDRVGAGLLFMPFHFCEASANMLTNDALDPLAKIPELKVCAANVRRAASRQ